MSAPETKDPERLDTAGDPTLRALLRAGREDVPNDAQLAVLAAKLGPIVSGGGGGGGSGAGGAAGGAAAKATTFKTVAGATLAKIVGVVTTVAVVGVATARYVAAPSPTRAPVATSVTTASPNPTAMAAAPAAPAATESEPAIPPAPSAVASSASPPAAPPALAPDPDAETKLLGRAQADLNGNPARALAEANELARRFPHGDLAQEREVVAIDALSRLGRHDEAGARATRFEAAYPQSAYRRRIDAMLER